MLLELCLNHRLHLDRLQCWHYRAPIVETANQKIMMAQWMMMKSERARVHETMIKYTLYLVSPLKFQANAYLVYVYTLSTVMCLSCRA